MYPSRPSSSPRGLALSVGAALLFGTALAPVAEAAKAPTTTSAKAAAKRKAPKKTAKKKPSKKKHARQAKQLGSGDGYRAFAALEPFTGPIGTVLHTKGHTTRFKLSDDPQNEVGFADDTERWVELGGGNRSREKITWFNYAGQVDSTLESWRDPRFAAVLSSNAPASVAIWCSDNHPYATADADLLARLHAATNLPAGPVIAGVATRVLTVPFDIGPEAPGTPPTFRYYVSAVTGVPVRSTYTPYDAPGPLGQTDYSLWEELPAGGSAQDLAGTVPLDADLGQGDGVRPGCIGH